MKKVYILLALVVAFTASTAYAAGKSNLLEAVLLKADKIAVKGNAALTGNIFNDSKTKGKNNPVTINDNLRVNGKVSFGNNSTGITGDSTQIYITGGLGISNDLAVGQSLRVDGAISTGTQSGPKNDGKPVVIDDHINVKGSLLVEGETTIAGPYLTLPMSFTQPPSTDCPLVASGRMVFDTTTAKLWICSLGVWKSFSAD